MKEQSKNTSEVWKKVLEKKVNSNKLLLAKSVKQENKPYKVQIFEVLAAETLNLHDQYVRWEVTKAVGDGGIDLIGYEKRNVATPFAQIFDLVSLGQVKRRTTSYRYDNFKADVGKINEYCLKTKFFEDKSLKQVIFVISTEAAKGISEIKNRMDNEDNPWLMNQRQSNISFIDADNLLKSWKMNYGYFENILKEALTSEELVLFRKYVEQYDFSWISTSVSAPPICSIGETILQTLSFNIDIDEIGMEVILRWIPPEPLNVQLIHPLLLVNPRQEGFPMHIYKDSQLILTFRGLKTGVLDFGAIELYSPKSEFLTRQKLNEVEISDGFSPVYYDKPYRETLHSLEQLCVEESCDFIPVLIRGCGGIGKSTLISEVFIHAAGRNFLCIDVAHPKDRNHERFIIKELFKNIIFPNRTEICFDSSFISNIRTFMGQNYNEKWEKDLCIFFTGESDYNSRTIAECLTTVIFLISAQKPVFLWLSDLHWMSEDAVNIINITIDELNNNQNILKHRVLWLFEGRDDEYIIIDNHPFFPAQWHRFMENSFTVNLRLSVWKPEECEEFVKSLFMINSEEEYIYDILIKQICSKANGVPMHMLELIKTLLEKKYVMISKNQRLLLTDHNYSECLSEDILIAIKIRIKFYRALADDFIDVLTVIAHLDCDIPAHLVSTMIKNLNEKYINFQKIKRQSAFIIENVDSIKFSHEHYHTIFRSLPVKNQDILSEFIDYYKALSHLSPKDRLALITLQKLSNNTKPEILRKDIMAFLTEEPSTSIQLLLYEYLAELPPLKKETEDFPLYYIYYQLCELYIYDGSWKTAEYYLQKQLDIPYIKEPKAAIYRIKAKQEMANILADRLYFEKAIKEALEGIELAELWMEKSSLIPKEYDSFVREKAKLQARLAVCYWFSGDIEKASKHQKESYRLSLGQKDKYAAAHVLYEIGTLEFHKRYDVGIKIMNKVISEIDEIPELKQYEQTLIEVQSLIGVIIKAAIEKNSSLLKKVKLESKELMEYYKSNPHSYEEFLCLTVRGIYFFLEGNEKSALICFFDSLRKAVESDMPNLEWKALFNIAQVYTLQTWETATRYAQKTRKILDDMKQNNPHITDCLVKMLQPVYDRLDGIEQKKDLTSLSIETNHNLLAVSIDGLLFTIMN
ncbi:hypothetical protein [Lacrimispora sp.]|uniref:hypothetical protein n=1 Tax=Lacrimispora sp. TaxID=2719234 RepID=UPI0034605815